MTFVTLHFLRKLVSHFFISLGILREFPNWRKKWEAIFHLFPDNSPRFSQFFSVVSRQFPNGSHANSLRIPWKFPENSPGEKSGEMMWKNCETWRGSEPEFTSLPIIFSTVRLQKPCNVTKLHLLFTTRAITMVITTNSTSMQNAAMILNFRFLLVFWTLSSLLALLTEKIITAKFSVPLNWTNLFWRSS